jgi:GTPase
MLYDRARIEVRAGAGGDGVVSFRREAHVPKGGPDGGDGGRGGDVTLVCDDSLRDLQAFRRRGHFRAGRGGHGQGALRSGAAGDDLVVPVPPGTQVTRWDGTRYDLVRPGQRAVLARGGAGGHGNKRFASATRQAPRVAERGLPGEEGWVELHLKLLADVGLVGLPNAGKSSLLARLTRARPKVADYPFTTLEPVLGTLDADDRQLVIADIPGLIEGAHEGAGLGHDFLAHVERTRLLVHVLDLAPLDGSDPAENHRTIERELAEHDPRLAALPRILALSKADLVPPEESEAAAEDWRRRLREESSVGVSPEAEEPAAEDWPAAAGDDVPVLVTSSATGQGLDDLARELLRRVPVEDPSTDGPPAEDDVAEYRLFRPAAAREFEVHKVGDRHFVVTGEPVDRLIGRHDLENEEALAHIEHRLRRMGVIAALERAGFEPGDDVEIGGVVFELHPGAPR